MWQRRRVLYIVIMLTISVYAGCGGETVVTKVVPSSCQELWKLI